MSFTLGYKVNADTDYEFTISNETLSEIVSTNGGITESDISDYCYSALFDSRVKSVFTGVSGISWTDNSSKATNCLAHMAGSTMATAIPTFNKTFTEQTDIVYQRNFLVWSGTAYPNTDNAKTGVFLIMDIKDIKKWIVNFDNAGFSENYSVETSDFSSYNVDFPGFTGNVYRYISNSNVHATVNPIETFSSVGTIRVTNVINVNNELWLGEFNPSTHGESVIGSSVANYSRYSTSSRAASYLRHPVANQNVYQEGSTPFGATSDYSNAPIYPPCPNPSTGSLAFSSWIETANDDMLIHLYGNWGQQNYAHAVNVSVESLTKSKNIMLKWQSWCGLKFSYGGKIYKPIIEMGVITGFSDDMTAKSEYDDMVNVTGNNIPSTPPVLPSHVSDNEIDMPLAYIGGNAGMVNFIKINTSDTADADSISNAISRFDITTIGKDLLRNLISYKCFAAINITDSVIRQIKIGGHGLTDDNNGELNGEYIGGLSPIDFTIGYVDTLYNDYRDYSPYTKIECYIPFCGWFELPPWCMGKTITGTMFTDLYNGTVKCVIYASQTVVAEVGGCCTYDIPFVADATGAKASAVISSALSTAAATAATIAIPNIATGIAAATSAANTISAANAVSTQVRGIMGDGSNLNGLLHCYLKITRPSPPNGITEIPASYKHSRGVPCDKNIVLSTGQGYTQILDANITGAMTDREKQMIIDGFRHGLIL